MQFLFFLDNSNNILFSEAMREYHALFSYNKTLVEKLPWNLTDALSNVYFSNAVIFSCAKKFFTNCSIFEVEKYYGILSVFN